MAFPVVAREQPEFVVVSEYAVSRLGKFPRARVAFEECVYLLSDEIPVVGSAGDEEGVDLLTVGELLGREDLVGSKVTDVEGNVLATIVGVTSIELEPAVENEDETVTPPVNGHDLLLDTPLDSAPAAIRLVERMPTGADAYRPANSGQSWEHVINGENLTQMGILAQALGTVYVNAALALLDELAIDVSPALIVGAVQSLAAKGVTIDTLMAHQGELIELARRAGSITGLTTYGTAP
jgi:hypothetical protein